MLTVPLNAAVAVAAVVEEVRAVVHMLVAAHIPVAVAEVAEEVRIPEAEGFVAVVEFMLHQ